MKRIYKYDIKLQEQQIISGPIIKPLSVQLQDESIKLWCEVDLSVPNRKYLITMVGTGNEIPKHAGRHLGTIQLQGFVLHVYGTRRLDNVID